MHQLARAWLVRPNRCCGHTQAASGLPGLRGEIRGDWGPGGRWAPSLVREATQRPCSLFLWAWRSVEVPWRRGAGRAAVGAALTPLYTQELWSRHELTNPFAIPPPELFCPPLSGAKGGRKLRLRAVGSQREREGRQALARARQGCGGGNHSPGSPARGGKRSQARRRHLGPLSEAKGGQEGKGRKKEARCGLLFGTRAARRPYGPSPSPPLEFPQGLRDAARGGAARSAMHGIQ